MEFFFTLEPDGDGWLVTFRSLPEAITGGSTRQEAIRNATDAVEVTLLTYAKDGRGLPPSDRKRHKGEAGSVTVSAAVVAKLAFIDAFRKSGLSGVALAQRLGKAESEVRRMLDPYHATKLPALEDAMKVLGKRFSITVEDRLSTDEAA
jgi:antitoxin HicB